MNTYNRSTSTTLHAAVFGLLIALLASAGPALAASTASKGIRVYDKGMQEGTRNYLVLCPSGTRNTVAQEFSVPEDDPSMIQSIADDDEAAPGYVTKPIRLIQTCVYPAKGDASCRKRWTVDNAAAYLCSKR